MSEVAYRKGSIRRTPIKFGPRPLAEVMALPVLTTINDPRDKLHLLGAAHFREAYKLLLMWQRLDEEDANYFDSHLNEIELQLLFSNTTWSPGKEVIVYRVDWLDGNNQPNTAKVCVAQRIGNKGFACSEVFSIYNLDPEAQAEVASVLTFVNVMVRSKVDNKRYASNDTLINWPQPNEV